MSDLMWLQVKINKSVGTSDRAIDLQMDIPVDNTAVGIVDSIKHLQCKLLKVREVPAMLMFADLLRQILSVESCQGSELEIEPVPCEVPHCHQS